MSPMPTASRKRPRPSSKPSAPSISGSTTRWRPSSALQLEALPQRIVVIHEERMLARHGSCCLDIRDDGGILTDLRSSGDAAALQRADDAFVPERMAAKQQSHCLE